MVETIYVETVNVANIIWAFIALAAFMIWFAWFTKRADKNELVGDTKKSIHSEALWDYYQSAAPDEVYEPDFEEQLDDAAAEKLFNSKKKK